MLFDFSDLTCHLEDTRTGVFLLHCGRKGMHVIFQKKGKKEQNIWKFAKKCIYKIWKYFEKGQPDVCDYCMHETTWTCPAVSSNSKETKLGGSHKEASPSAGKINLKSSFNVTPHMKVTTANSGGMDISQVSGYHFFKQMSSWWGSQKLLQILVSHELTVYLSVFDIFLTQWIMANLGDSVDSENFSVTVNLPLIWKDSITQMHGLAVYRKWGLLLTQDLSLQTPQIYFFFLYWSPSFSLNTVFDSFHLT